MRTGKQWFEFRGIRSDDMGVWPVDFPRMASGAQRAEARSVPGRHGCLYVSDNTLSEFDIPRTVRLHQSRLNEARQWLRGAGDLVFSHRPDAVFDARILKNVEFRQILPGEDPLWEAAVTFTCQPLPRMHPPAAESVFTRSGELLPTPENAAGLPRITIEGSGSFALTIGAETMLFTGVEDGVIVDSELGDVLTLDGGSLANDKASGPLFRPEDGMNTVSWMTGLEDEPGSVTRVTILPRWRWK